MTVEEKVEELLTLGYNTITHTIQLYYMESESSLPHIFLYCLNWSNSLESRLRLRTVPIF